MSVGFPKGGFVVSGVKDKLKEINKERGLDIDEKIIKKLAEIFEYYTYDDDLPDLHDESKRPDKSLEIFNRVKDSLSKLSP